MSSIPLEILKKALVDTETRLGELRFQLAHMLKTIDINEHRMAELVEAIDALKVVLHD